MSAATRRQPMGAYASEPLPEVVTAHRGGARCAENCGRKRRGEGRRLRFAAPSAARSAIADKPTMEPSPIRGGGSVRHAGAVWVCAAVLTEAQTMRFSAPRKRDVASRATQNKPPISAFARVRTPSPGQTAPPGSNRTTEGWRPSKEKQMNLHIIVGRVGQDPEVKYLHSGTAVCNLSVATDDPVKDAQGNFTTKATWHRVTFFGRQAESIGQHVRKGRSIAVQGTVRRRRDEEKGVRVRRHHRPQLGVRRLGEPRQPQQRQRQWQRQPRPALQRPSQRPAAGSRSRAAPGRPTAAGTIGDDDIPF